MRRYRRMQSPIGELTLVAEGPELVAILFENQRDDREASLQEMVEVTGSDEALDEVETQLSEYFDGRRTVFDLRLRFAGGTEFQRECWQIMQTIPHGETWSYEKQAATLGRPNAVRAVGAANGKNPIPVVVPCHRVLGKNGSLTGFAGGIELKRWLLDHEGHAQQQQLSGFNKST